MDASDTERLLRQTAWLRTLAGSLLRDPQDADDVVQDTWLAALRRPPDASGGDAGVRGWLWRVAQNAAHMRARGEARRRQREAAVARSERLPGAAAAYERMSMQRALLDAVMALEDADREVVVLRYFDQLSPRAIAQQTGTTSAAVRTRLSRALARLRTRLEREHGKDDWRGALLTVALGGGRRTLWWSLIMSGTMKVIVSGIVAALAVLCWWEFGGSTPPAGGAGMTPVSMATTAPVAGAAAAGTGERTVATNERQQVEQATPAGAATAPKGGQLVVLARVVDPAGVPIPGARMIAFAVAGRPEVPTDVEGRARLVLDWPAKLTSGNPSWIEVEVTAAGRNRVRRQQRAQPAATVQFGDFELVPAGSVTGVVRGTGGAPAANVYVQMIQPVAQADAATLERLRVTGRGLRTIDVALQTLTDAAGAWRIDGVPAGSLAVAAKAHDGYWSHTGEVTVPAGGEVRAPDLVVEPLGDANRIRGRVVDHDGTPVVGAEIDVFANHGARNVDGEARGRAGADARFEVAVLSGRRYTLQVKHPRTHDRIALQHDVEAGSEVTVTFPIERSLTLVVTDAAGAPVDKPLVMGVSEDNLGMSLRSRREGPGLLRVVGPAEPFRMQVSAPGFRAQMLGPFAHDALPERVTATLQAAPAIRGRVTADGAGIAGARLHLHRVPEGSALRRFAADLQTRLDAPFGGTATSTADGVFTIPVPVPGRYVVHAEVDGRAMAESSVLDLSGNRSIDDVELPSTAGATLTGEVLVAPGVAVEGMLIAATRGDGHALLQVVGSDGAFRFAGLTAGEWQVRRCEPDDQQSLRQGRTWPERERQPFAVDVVVPATGEVHYRLDLTAEVPAVLRGRLTFGGAAAAGWTARLQQGKVGTEGRTDALGRFELRARKPGMAMLTLTNNLPQGQLRLQRTFELTAGENAWGHTMALGAMTITELPAAEAPHDQVPLPGYALTWTAVEGVSCAFQFDAKDGGLRVDGLPVGTVELRRRPAKAYVLASDWPVHGSAQIRADARTELTWRP